MRSGGRFAVRDTLVPDRHSALCGKTAAEGIYKIS